MSAPTRNELSMALRVAARSRDPELAAYAKEGLRRLNKAPAVPRRPRRVTARVTGLVRS